MKNWVPDYYTCAGCDKVDKNGFFASVRYAGQTVRFCMGRGSDPKVGCVHRFAIRSRICVGCSKGEVVANKYAHKWKNYYSDMDKNGTHPGRLCGKCQDALERGREARREDKREDKKRAKGGSRVWILSAQHFEGYTMALANALTSGRTWDADAVSAPKGESIREGYRDSREFGGVKLESAQLDPGIVWALKIVIDKLLLKAERKGYRDGNNLLGHLADGRYTAPEYDDAQERAERDYDERLECIEDATE